MAQARRIVPNCILNLPCLRNNQLTGHNEYSFLGVVAVSRAFRMFGFEQFQFIITDDVQLDLTDNQEYTLDSSTFVVFYWSYSLVLTQYSIDFNMSSYSILA